MLKGHLFSFFVLKKNKNKNVPEKTSSILGVHLTTFTKTENNQKSW